MKTYNFKKLFEYAGKEYEVLWAECYKIFFKTGVLTYEGTTTLYFTDIEDSLRESNIRWASGDTESALRILRSFINDECITRDIKISHK